MVYLNQAGTSWPKPAVVTDAVSEVHHAPPETWGDRLRADHRAVAAALGIADPARLLLTPGCTSALAVAVADHPWEPGDRVLTSGLEHHALQRPVGQLASRGVDVGVVPRGEDESVVLAELERALAGGRVRLVAMAAACNVTGECLPVEAIVHLAHEHGALCLIDGAQLAGWVDLDVPGLGVDLFAFAGHKAPQGPYGIGGLYVSPDVTMASPASACELPVDGGQPSCAAMPGACDVGSVDRPALAGLAAGLAWVSDPSRADRLARARQLIARFQAAVIELPGVTLHGPADVERRMPSLALTARGHTVSALGAALAARGIQCAAGLQCAALAHESLGTAPDGVLRFSVGPSNTADDVDLAAAALAALLS